MTLMDAVCTLNLGSIILRLWAPTSASHTVSAVADPFVKIKQLETQRIKLPAFCWFTTGCGLTAGAGT